MKPTCQSPVIVALDFAEPDQGLALAQQLSPQQCRLKIGKQLFTLAGPELVKSLVAMGYEVFLDLKFHDIPVTVAKAVSATAELGVWMVNVHASGGGRMMQAAREAIDQCRHQPLLIAVTVLTSMEQTDLNELGIVATPQQQVIKLAGLAQQYGMDGVVCSARETASLRQAMGDDFLLVTPGIRPATAAQDDQRRIATPNAAVTQGSNYLVIGRPITQQPDPVAALQAINKLLGC